jgi:hypothetical protein
MSSWGNKDSAHLGKNMLVLQENLAGAEIRTGHATGKTDHAGYIYREKRLRSNRSKVPESCSGMDAFLLACLLTNGVGSAAITETETNETHAREGHTSMELLSSTKLR